MLYKINQSNDNSQSLDITQTKDKENRNDNNDNNVLDHHLNESSIKLNTSNNTIMTDQAIIDHHEDDKENHDNDLNIIPLNA